MISLIMPAINNPTQAPVAQVSMTDIRRQMMAAVHSSVVTVPDDYLMHTASEKNRPAPTLALPAQGLRVLAQALLSPAPAPNARLLALKRKAQEWFG